VERFFIKSCSIDEIVDIEELLLSRYSNIEYILNLNFIDGLVFIRKAYEKQHEEKLYEQWLVDYRNMTKETFISFSDYKERAIKKNTVSEKLTKEQIENKVKNIIELTL